MKSFISLHWDYFPFSMWLLFWGFFFFKTLPFSSLILSCCFDFLHLLTLPSITIASFVSYLCYLPIHFQLSKFLDLICGPHFLATPPHKALLLYICLQNNASRAEANKLKKEDEQNYGKPPKVWMGNIIQPFCLSSILPDPKIAFFTIPEHCLLCQEKKIIRASDSSNTLQLLLFPV